MNARQVLTLFVLCALTLKPLTAQERFSVTPEFRAAREFILTGYFDKGVQAFLKIANDNPRTVLGANALEQAAEYTSSPQDKALIFQRLIAEYPRTRYEVAARASLLWFQYGYQNAQGYIQSADRLVTSFGGPSLREISQSQGLNRLSNQIWALPEEYQVGLSGVYKSLAGLKATRLGQYQDALPLAVFNRQTFAKFDESGQLGRDVQFYWAQANRINFNDFKPILVDPKLRVRPRNNRLGFGPRPRFTFETSTGPLPTAQVNLASSKFLLDGKSLLPRLKISSHVNLKSGKHQKQPFEVIRLSGRPEQQLSNGPHTLEVEIRAEGYRPGGPGLTKQILNFYVRPNCDDDDDNAEDDRWDSEW